METNTGEIFTVRPTLSISQPTCIAIFVLCRRHRLYYLLYICATKKQKILLARHDMLWTDILPQGSQLPEPGPNKLEDKKINISRNLSPR